ncbi:TldD/PmbA family protein [Bartonella sp. DGB2]|uniref:TldD/PmbA family protein n=1 Tax=Bartonella sp. DGB2 TaxID=3388426 RepID=UPI00399003DE
MSALIDRFDISAQNVESLVQHTLSKADDGELFIEYYELESLVFDNGRLKSGSFQKESGFGLRAVAGEGTGYAHSGEFSKAALTRASEAVKAVFHGHKGIQNVAPRGIHRTNHKLYPEINPLESPSFEEKVRILQQIDQYLRNKTPQVRQVTVMLRASYQHIELIHADGAKSHDIRPLCQLVINVVVAKGEKQETGFYGCGGRQNFDQFINATNWRASADEALRAALVNLEAEAPPAGNFDIVLGNGVTGVMLHEAVGHGLEGDFNRQGTSAFSNLIGEQVAAKGVTIVDDGSLPNCRGSLNIDDEGTPTGCHTLIEDGKLVGYMQDRLNGRLMGGHSTGNGRRQSYAHTPLPRMTNTFMLNGGYSSEEIIASVKNGIYAVSFGGGQVDITSGKFVFECTEAYRIENGKIKAPIKGAMLIGNGPEAMKRITMVGNDAKLDPGLGTCSKDGQSLPVGVGQPHVRINGLTIGGTAIAP